MAVRKKDSSSGNYLGMLRGWLSVVRSQWSVVRGQLSVVSGQLLMATVREGTTDN